MRWPQNSVNSSRNSHRQLDRAKEIARVENYFIFIFHLNKKLGKFPSISRVKKVPLTPFGIKKIHLKLEKLPREAEQEVQTVIRLFSSAI